MKCSDCGKTLKKYFAFSEKNEKYYCMDCCYKYVNKGIVFFKCKNNKLIRLNVGVSGAGGGDIHDKFYENNKWLLTHEKICEHALSKFNENKPIFFCEDRIILCPDCFYKSNFDIADPILKLNANKFMWLIPYTYDPYNLKFDFTCDNTGIKGNCVNLNLSIENNRKYPITDICIKIEAFAQDIEHYWGEANPTKYLILKKIHIESINPKEEIHLPLECYIPLDDEVKDNDFNDYPFEDEYYEFQEPNKKLKVPNNLKIFVHFSYKSYTGFRYYSYVKSKEIKLKSKKR